MANYTATPSQIYDANGNLINNPQIQDTNISNTPINTSLLSSNQNPITLPTPPTDTNNYQGIISGGQFLADYFKNNVANVANEAPKDLTTLFNDLYKTSGLEEKQTKSLESQKSLDVLNAQMGALNAEAQAAPIQVEKDFLGRAGVNEQANISRARLRDIALKSLPLQGQILAQQAIATGDQRALEAAQNKFNTVFQIQQKNEEQQYNYRKDQRDKIWSYLTEAEKTKLAAVQKEDDRKFTLLTNNLNNAQSLAGKAIESGQADLASKITALDPKSTTYQTDLANLAGQIKPTLTASQKVGGGNASDLAGLPTGFVTAVQSGQTGDTLLNSLPSIDKATIQSILDYTKNPANLSLRKAAGEAQSEREKFLSMAHLIDPTYDETQYATRSAIKKDFNSGKSAQNIRSLNTAIGHLDTLDKAGTALANASIPLWNAIANKGLSAVGNTRVTNFNTAATAVEGELANVFKGMGATDQEIKVWRENINSSQSPDQIKGAINTAIELMGSRLQALTNQYEIGIGKPKDFKILSDKSRKILSGLGVDVEAIDPVKTPAQGISGGGNNFSIADPTGAIHTFPDQKSLDAFKKAAGL